MRNAVAMTSKPVLVALLALPIACTTRAAAEDAGIYVMKIDGGGERKVATVDGVLSHLSPRFSHDGQRLAFEVVADGGVRMTYVVNLDGTELTEVAKLGRPDWSPDDKQLCCDDDNWNSSDIFVLNLDGSGRTKLTEGAWPRWSPDGSRIAYCAGNELMVLNLENSEKYSLSEGRYAQRPGAFDWSHDGKRLALFTRTDEAGPRELYIVDADGDNKDLMPRYSRPGMVGAHVTWSPDDKQLIFTVDSMIHTLEVDGKGEPQLVPNQSELNRDPAASPDGKWIAFARRPVSSRQ